MKKVVVIKSGGANFASIIQAFARMQITCELTDVPRVIQQATHVILPGVGMAATAMRALTDADLISVIRELTQPVLGICLGMQLLAEFSEEGDVQGLGIVPGVVKKIKSTPGLVLPHMGWNNLSFKTAHPLLNKVSEQDNFYFVHSYALPVNSTTMASCEYSDDFSAVISRDNFHGTQFHPEKSGTAGEKILANFLEM